MLCVAMAGNHGSRDETVAGGPLKWDAPPKPEFSTLAGSRRLDMEAIEAIDEEEDEANDRRDRKPDASPPSSSPSSWSKPKAFSGGIGGGRKKDDMPAVAANPPRVLELPPARMLASVSALEFAKEESLVCPSEADSGNGRPNGRSGSSGKSSRSRHWSALALEAGRAENRKIRKRVQTLNEEEEKSMRTN